MDELQRVLKRQVRELASSVLSQPQRPSLARSAEADVRVGLGGHERMFPRSRTGLRLRRISYSLLVPASSSLSIRPLDLWTMFWLIAVGGALVAASGASSSRSVVPVNGRIAFAKGSDLFSITPNGQDLRRLTSGAGVDGEPAWSPDGHWLAFSRTEARTKITNVYVVAASGGRPRLLVQGARSPSWAPTGRRLAVFRLKRSCSRLCPGARGVWTVPFDGGKPRLASAGAWSSDWSASGRELAVMDPDGIAIVILASGAVRRVSGFRGQPGDPLDWSPDDSRFVLVTGEGVVTVSVADGSIKTLVARQAMAGPTSCSSLGPATWSPDGQWIAYEETRCVTNEGPKPFPIGAISVIDGDGAWHHDIDNLIWGYSMDFGPYNAVWAPNSRSLAFIDDEIATDGEEFLGVASMPPTAGYKRLTAGARGAPSWQRLSP